MKRFNSTCLMLAIASSFITGCIAISLSDQPSHQETRTLAIEHMPESSLSVVSENGSIDVAQSDGTQVRISARIKAVSEERLKAVQIIAMRTANNTLELYADWPMPGRKSNEGCDFQIQIPDAAGIRLRSSNGRLAIERLAGQADLQTSNGSIAIRQHRGSSTAQTSNGAIRVDEVAGTLHLRSSNGQIDVQGAAGEVKGQTSNGNVRVALAEGSAGPIEARTSNGSVKLELTQSFVGELIMQTSLGSIDIKDMPQARLIASRRNFLQLGFGSGGPTSHASTSNGSITVRMKKD